MKLGIVGRIVIVVGVVAAIGLIAFVNEVEAGHSLAAASVAVSLLVLLGVVAYLLRVAILPVRRISSAVEQLARGELTARVPTGGPFDTTGLAQAFNTMAESLQGSRDLLEQQVNVNRTVLDSTIDGICLTDVEGTLLLANRPLIQFAIEVGLPLGGTVQENLLAVADRFTDPEGYRAAIAGITPELNEPTLDEFAFADSDRCFQGFTSPVQDAEGKLVGRVWTLREVTRERVADRLKDEFIATVSHELRTPLTSIVGFLEMLLEGDAGPLADEQRRFLEIVMRSSQRLMRQVGDLLFISRLDSAGLALQTEDVDLPALVHEAVEQVAALARQREIELSVDVPESLAVECDRERIAQVVGNLLSNAVKFTPGGGTVAIRARHEGESAVVEVEDSGIGIPDAERARLFERFFRSSRATQHAIQGTGLGLAIAHAIVEAHGGVIEAEPAPVKGTLFRFTVPLRVPAELAR